MADFLKKLEEGMKALETTSSLSAAEIVSSLNEKTMEVREISHRGAANPFSYTVSGALIQSLKDKGVEASDLDVVKGWKIETPKKDIGPFWSIVQNLRGYADSRFISGTRHMRLDNFEKFLEKYRAEKQRWDEARVELETKYDELKLSYWDKAQRVLEAEYPGTAHLVLSDLKSSTPSKEAYLNGLALIVDCAESDNKMLLLSAENKATLDELRENSAQRRVKDMVAGTLQGIIDSTATLLAKAERRSDGKWLSEKTVKSYRQAIEKAKADNLFDNPTINEIITEMGYLHESLVAEDEATATDSIERILGMAYAFSKEVGMKGDLSWVSCPFDEATLELIASSL